MARGISTNFLNLARREQRLAVRTAVAAAALALPAAFLADLADIPGYGPVWVLFVLTCGAGLVVGAALARGRVAHYEADLQLQWNHYMRGAVNAGRIADVDRKVHEKDPLPPVLSDAAAVVLASLNVLVFVLLWVEHPLASPLSWAVVAVDGLALGTLVTSSALMGRWARSFVRTAEDLVQKGEIPVWGER
jgi:hypothetical protein